MFCSHSRYAGLADGWLTLGAVSTARPSILTLGLEANEAELSATRTCHVLALGSVFNEHPTGRTSTARWSLHSHHILLRGFS